MKAIIENFVLFVNVGTEMGQDNYLTALSEFNIILTFIKMSCGKENLRSFLKDQSLNYFVYGFGSSHMWVHQVVDGEPLKDRLMIVEF
jgi:hypothetical protein